MQVASAIMPVFITWASICPNPACNLFRPASSGIRIPAGRMIWATRSPGADQELLDASVDAGAHEGLVELDLRLVPLGFGSGLLGRQ